MRLFSGGLAGVCIGDDGQLSGASLLRPGFRGA